MNEYIYKYTREQAIQDGVLIDVTPTAMEIGFIWPVAITDTVFHSIIEPSDELIQQGHTTEKRLWHSLMMLRYNANKDSSIIYFYIFLDFKEKQKNWFKLKAVAGPGDDGEPTITIMFPYED